MHVVPAGQADVVPVAHDPNPSQFPEDEVTEQLPEQVIFPVQSFFKSSLDV